MIIFHGSFYMNEYDKSLNNGSLTQSTHSENTKIKLITMIKHIRVILQSWLILQTLTSRVKAAKGEVGIP